MEALAPALREAVGLTVKVLLPLRVLEAVPEPVPVPVGLPVPLLLALAPRVMEGLLLPVAAGDTEALRLLSGEAARLELLLRVGEAELLAEAGSREGAPAAEPAREQELLRVPVGLPELLAPAARLLAELAD